MERVRIDSSELGRFVLGEPELGVGRLVGLDGPTARVRYFTGPTAEPYVEREAPASHLTPVRLRPHTRVYFHDGRRWRIGRIDAEQPDADGRFVVALPNGDGQILGVEQFDVRWSPRVKDPYEILGALGGDSPVVYEPRVELISSWYRQRAVAAGVEGLLLGSVELHQHQLSVVRSVANDGERRYLLADEVGLGKTIEAGALVWQAMCHHPSARVLVLAPDHLRQQWAEELLDKFHVGLFPDAWLRIRSHDDSGSWPDESVDMLVVDEAHHLTRAGRSTPEALRRLAQLAHAASEVLLLTATPVRSNEAAFLDLLHLLDPRNYRPEDLASFTRRVEMRDELALLHYALSPDLDEFDLSLYADQLRSTFPDDWQLAEYVDEASVCSDQERPACIERIKDHLSETYRLHHRLLRTRRTQQITSSFGVRGRRRGRPFTVEIPDESDELRVDLIESFRRHLAELVDSEGLPLEQAVAAFRKVCQACGSLPTALLALANHGSDGDSGSGDEVTRWFRSHGDAWRRHLEALEPVQLDSVVRQVGEMAVAKNLGKVIVSTAYTSVAEAFAGGVATAYGEHRVARHLQNESRDENARNVEFWQSNDGCRLLVCDAGAEEGINLQAADAIIHLDLPWEIFRLEQRIGRADRYVRGGMESVASMVLVYGEQSYALGWFLFAADSCGVFDRSVSSLQYVLADLEHEVLGQAIMKGSAVFDIDVDDRRDRLDGEGQRIAAHDSLDSVRGEHAALNSLLLDLDSDSRFPRALVGWLGGVGAKVARPGPGTIRVANRPRPQVPFELEAAMATWMNQELALTRSAALDRRLPLVRAGHGFVDKIVRHLENDDRGIAFAFFRPLRNHWPPTIVLRTDFLVRVRVPQQVSSVANGHGLGHWVTAECESAAPPLLETVYTSITGDSIDGSLLRPYDRTAGDRNLGSRPELFEALTSHVNWEEVCRDGLGNARRILDNASSLAAAREVGERLRESVNTRLAILRARARSGIEPVEVQLRAFEDLRQELSAEFEVEVVAVGCGAVLLGDPKLVPA